VKPRHSGAQRQNSAGGETLGIALGGLAIDEQSEALLERECVEIGRASLLLEGLGHSGQAESAQALEVGCVSIGIVRVVEVRGLPLATDVAVAQGFVLRRFLE